MRTNHSTQTELMHAPQTGSPRAKHIMSSLSPALATPGPFLQMRDYEQALRERDEALEERTRLLGRAKQAVEQLHGELERTRREADEFKGQARALTPAARPTTALHRVLTATPTCTLLQARATIEAQAARVAQLELAVSVRESARGRGRWRSLCV